MNQRIFTTLAFCTLWVALHAQENHPEVTEQWSPKPRKVAATPHPGLAAPADAILLFDGTNTDAWTHEDGTAVGWTVEEGILTVQSGTGDIRTKERFGDCQLHLEFRIPEGDPDSGQDLGNSGVFLQERYEVQILGSHTNETYSNGQCGAIYKQYMPLVNASRPPGEWQTYDIIYEAPKFNADGYQLRPAYLTVIHNGVLIHQHRPLLGTTEYIGLPKVEPHGPAPIKLQDHDNPTSFRNIWVRKL